MWVSGVAAPGVDDDTLAAGLAAPLSGDWRRIGGNLELVAALAVNTPGFPVVASGATDEADQPLALVASLAPTEQPALAASVDAVADAVMQRLDDRDAAQARAREATSLVDSMRHKEATRLVKAVH